MVAVGSIAVDVSGPLAVQVVACGKVLPVVRAQRVITLPHRRWSFAVPSVVLREPWGLLLHPHPRHVLMRRCTNVQMNGGMVRWAWVCSRGCHMCPDKVARVGFPPRAFVGAVKVLVHTPPVCCFGHYDDFAVRGDSEHLSIRCSSGCTGSNNRRRRLFRLAASLSPGVETRLIGV